MTVGVSADVGGHVITVNVNSCCTTISRHDAFLLAHYLSHLLDSLAQDDRAAEQQAKIRARYFGESNGEA